MLPSRFFPAKQHPDAPPAKKKLKQDHHPHEAEKHKRLSTASRLAQFLNTKATEQRQAASSSEQARALQAKIAAARAASTAVKWEQPQSMWEPGVEQKKHKAGNPAGHATAKDSLDEDEDDEGEEDRELSPQKKTKKQKNPQAVKSTQLEQQWAEFKKQYPKLVIFMEVGYKIRLFGPDAVLASQVLSIGHLAIPGRETAFFPKTSLHVHLSRMIMAGHKVGLFVQSETRALRNPELVGVKGAKGRVFSRHLAGVYSLSTWTESDPSQGFAAAAAAEPGLVQNWIVSFHASSPPTSGRNAQDTQPKTQLSMAAICPQTGEIVWDSWADDPIRSMLETRMSYFRPVEILVPLSGLDGPSEKLINWIIKNPLARSTVKPRLESTDQDYTPQAAYQLVSRFCQPVKRKPRVSRPSSQDEASEGDSAEPEFLHHIVELPDGVLIALAGLIVHMKSYQLESIFRQPGQFRSFSSQSYMILDANTLKNLEIFENSTDRTERGSLFWVLDRTKTAMGKRMLKQWIGKPLVDQNMLKERADAVEELIASQSHPILIKMRRLLGMRLPDLEKTLVRIQYGKCTEKELLRFLEVMVELTATFGSGSTGKAIFGSRLLQEIFAGFSAAREQTMEYRSELNSKAILKGEYEDMFVNAEELYPELTDLKDCLSCIEAECAEHLQACRVTLENPKLEYITVGSEEMLIEVRHQQVDRVPENWMKFGSTRAVQRFRTAEATRLLAERDKYRDLIVRASRGYFEAFLGSMGEAHDVLRDAVNKLGLADCLLSLATVAAENRYSRPRIVPHPAIEISNGRHPIVEQIIDNPLVPNNCEFAPNGLSTMILTGNNMGGKSVTAKMIGCIVLLAQMGSYVPAERATIGLFDGCYTRMGMSEELAQGRSAFMVEMNEAAKILRMATPRSLVIIDELGYGTSTYDGLAIANAVLDHLASSIRCFTIFITHYPQLNEIAIKYPERVKSYHMKFLECQVGSKTEDEEEGEGDGGQITFLYKLAAGLATKSHGIHVARLAGLPSPVLHRARRKSKTLEESVGRKNLAHRASVIKDLLLSLSSSSSASGNDKHSSGCAPDLELLSRAQILLSSLCLSTGSE